MFPQLKKINNKSGVVLFMVLMAAIVIMILSVGLLTSSMNEVNYSQQQIDQIVTDELAKGVFWNAYANGIGGGNIGISTVMQGRNYHIHVNSYNVTANFDSFN